MSGGEPPVVLIKLGGSVLTDKRRPDTVRSEVLARLAAEIVAGQRASGVHVVLGHGSGSFGHMAASRHDLGTGVRRADQLPGVAATQAAARALDVLVCDALRAAGASPFALAPSSFAVAPAGRLEADGLEPLLLALDLGLLPVTYGDVVLDRERGASIGSTETVFELLTRHLAQCERAVARILWVGETDGIYAADGQTVREIDEGNYATVLGHTGGSAGVDVTGGMRHRLEAVWGLASRGIESWIGNGLVAGNLEAALCGKPAGGTWVRQW